MTQRFVMVLAQFDDEGGSIEYKFWNTTDSFAYEQAEYMTHRYGLPIKADGDSAPASLDLIFGSGNGSTPAQSSGDGNRRESG